jgi:dihydroorotate dehydrogenase electron transfer subunit
MKSYDTADCTVLRNRQIAPGCFDLTLSCPEMARRAKAGQFAQFSCRVKLCAAQFLFAALNRKKGL